MNTTRFWASVALLFAPGVVAQSSPTTTTSATPSCTASLTTKVCGYKGPGDSFAVAEDRPGCWNYCNTHPPCNFVIFNPGNPFTGDGTCWLYPGETFDANTVPEHCGGVAPYLEVYSQPVCTGGPTPTPTPTPTSGACTATATPSAVAPVCGYPAPATCDDDCLAELSVVDCLSSCVKADSCSYVVYNPGEGDVSPYAAGNCWIFPSGSYNASAASTSCSITARLQFVYNNPCPKASPSPAASSSATGSAGGTVKPTSQGQGSGTKLDNAAAGGLSLFSPIVVGVAVMMLRGFQ